jgi:hypothetical protein
VRSNRAGDTILWKTMLKKIVVAVLLLIVIGTVALGILARRAPALLRAAIERSLKKPVVIGSIEYRFPGSFDIEGFEVRENAPFAGETAFKADHIRVHASPFGLSKQKLVIEEIEVDGASVTIRKLENRLYHALSSVAPAENKPSKELAGALGAPDAADKGSAMPLEIGRFHLVNGHFEFADYDAVEGGFVTALDGIHADVRQISLPFNDTPTSYKISAQVSQGRDQKAADFQAGGWTRFSTLDTDAQFDLKGLFLPYFRPYYGSVTPAMIQSGSLDSKALLKIDRKQLTANADFEIVGLLFQSYEGGNELFGLNADQIIGFLKDSSGKLKFQIAAAWDLGDRNVRPRDVIRKSIERSLKRTVFGNVGNIAANAIRRYAGDGEEDPTATGKAKDDLQDAITKVKDFFDR